MKTKDKIRLALFASGNGSNAQNIVEYFKETPRIETVCIYSNKPQAYVVQRAAMLDVKCVVFSKDDLYHSQRIEEQLKADQTDFIILAGFLLKIPQKLVEAYPERIINIHPALLPAYGGRGMYGEHVHRAVKAAGEQHSGITIHLVNQHYDKGAIIFQKETALSPDDSPEDIADKVHRLEYQYFPKVIEEYITKYYSSRQKP